MEVYVHSYNDYCHFDVPNLRAWSWCDLVVRFTIVQYIWKIITVACQVNSLPSAYLLVDSTFPHTVDCSTRIHLWSCSILSSMVIHSNNSLLYSVLTVLPLQNEQTDGWILILLYTLYIWYWFDFLSYLAVDKNSEWLDKTWWFNKFVKRPGYQFMSSRLALDCFISRQQPIISSPWISRYKRYGYIRYGRYFSI